MTCNENNKLELGHVMWLANNNEQEYRSKELPAPAETEVSEIVQAELERIHRRFMYERGINMADVPDQYVAKQWLEDQEPTEGFLRGS